VRVQGWNMAFKDDGSKPLTADELDAQAAQRKLELHFLDGVTWTRVSSLSKPVRKAIAAETHILSKDSPRFIYGQGINS
jgi:hypothetical protein